MRTEITLALTLTIVAQTVGRYEKDVEHLTYAVNAFSQRLHNRIGIPLDSVVYSPYSIHSAMTLAYLGAGGETAQEMSRRLNFGEFDPRQAYSTITSKLVQQSLVMVDMAYAVIYRRHITLQSSFARDLQSVFWGTAATFGATDESVENSVNKFVDQTTQHNIPHILSRGRVTPKSSIIIVNVIFLKGNWDDPFQQAQTRQRQFNTVTGQKIVVPMMLDNKLVEIKKDFKIGADVIQLTLYGGQFGLYIALPHMNVGIKELERRIIKLSTVESIFTIFERKYVVVGIPKFRLLSQFNLKDALQRLGFLRTFTASHANFTGMCSYGGLYLSDMFHTAMIDVNESGISAATTNALNMAKRSVTQPQETFYADRPFLFFLRDNEHKVILFQGKFSG